MFAVTTHNELGLYNGIPKGFERIFDANDRAKMRKIRRDDLESIFYGTAVIPFYKRLLNDEGP